MLLYVLSMRISEINPGKLKMFIEDGSIDNGVRHRIAYSEERSRIVKTNKEAWLSNLKQFCPDF